MATLMYFLIIKHCLLNRINVFWVTLSKVRERTREMAKYFLAIETSKVVDSNAVHIRVVNIYYKIKYYTA